MYCFRVFVNKYFANFTGKKLDNFLDQECEVFRMLLLYENKHEGRFSNLHQCTFKTHDVTLLGLFHTLFFKVVQCLWFLDIHVREEIYNMQKKTFSCSKLAIEIAWECMKLSIKTLERSPWCCSGILLSLLSLNIFHTFFSASIDTLTNLVFAGWS